MRLESTVAAINSHRPLAPKALRIKRATAKETVKGTTALYGMATGRVYPCGPSQRAWTRYSSSSVGRRSMSS
jgi:hypothetical protein